ncbi:hypothetical protein [Leifsonia sp. C5G2]|uniref:hypothetical protein n=1 Tax=Leifsonia sp. C5G2 TaxID=2735269 RepID=UPI0015850DE0|nr:hypothetical protein [Leifsonia sp. C5G2]NUU06274.1 hypothetical protein [Leifsonia sp. C5G2]
MDSHPSFDDGVPSDGDALRASSERAPTARSVAAIVITDDLLITMDHALPRYYLTADETWAEALIARLRDDLKAMVDVERVVMSNRRSTSDGNTVEERWYLCRLRSMPEVDGRVGCLTRAEVESGQVLDLAEPLVRVLRENWPAAPATPIEPVTLRDRAAGHAPPQDPNPQAGVAREAGLRLSEGAWSSGEGMRVVRMTQGTLDIDDGGEVLRLFGELTLSGFIAWIGGIELLHPERRRLSKQEQLDSALGIARRWADPEFHISFLDERDELVCHTDSGRGRRRRRYRRWW